MPTPEPSSRAVLPIVRTLALLVAVLMLVGLVPAAPANAGSASLPLTPDASSWSRISSKRTTSIASAAVTIPSAVPVTFGFQFRAKSTSSGYRARLSVAADGSLSGSFSRVASGRETMLGDATDLGIRVQPGDVINLEAAVAALKSVRLYLRAWRGGSIKPPTWQLTAKDASRKRLKKAGYTYLWARPDVDTTASDLACAGVSVKSYSASKAAAVGVVAPEPNSDQFSIAVMPDTQAETNNTANTPFLNRVNWMVANTSRFDLRYVLHTGDMVNWGWLDAGQFTRAKAAVAVLRNAGLPYALAIGNHDTEVVGWNGVPGSSGYGGSAYAYNPECPVRLGAGACKSWLLVRKTGAFNQSFPLSSIQNVGGAYEAGKIDNYWTTFNADDTQWLVLTLELWPRKEVVAWAKDVVASHPNVNVIIQTHSYLTGGGKISASDGGYGATSPKYLYDQVVKPYANVKLVFSGHTGKFTTRTDTYRGHTVVSYLGNELSGAGNNPVRIVTINTRTGVVSSAVYNPLKGATAGTTSNRISLVR
ncbi:MAG: hypothetical protein CVT65_01585 [Actinobacteria bacterium HGW-Actinobacteria-5]|jgi:hypothetical protein|nr:MAG: hypothetical protein CVT65_01585 [Actinobacteria bacterium HGW-Actinobacteria-5]